MRAVFGLLLLCTGASVSAQQQMPADAAANKAPTTDIALTTVLTADAASAVEQVDDDAVAPNAASNTDSAIESARAEDTLIEDVATAADTTAASDSAISALADSELRAVPLYEEYELIEWINENHHLERVRDQDNCQLVQDIEARAEVLRLPSYQFLWGDMLAWGVCVPQQSRRGLAMLWKAADQGLPAALEQLGRYYYNGTLVQKNRERAAPLMKEAASLGLEKAQFTWARWLLSGVGSPLDYPQAYLWLKQMVLGDEKLHQEAEQLSTALAARMPAHKVKELNNRLLF